MVQGLTVVLLMQPPIYILVFCGCRDTGMVPHLVTRVRIFAAKWLRGQRRTSACLLWSCRHFHADHSRAHTACALCCVVAM